MIGNKIECGMILYIYFFNTKGKRDRQRRSSVIKLVIKKKYMDVFMNGAYSARGSTRCATDMT